VPKFNMMKIWSQVSGLRGLSSGNVKLFSGNIFGERPLVDANEWDLHVKVVCGCRSSLHRYCLWWSGSGGDDTKQWYFLYTHTHTYLYYHLPRYTETNERCYRHLSCKLADYIY
jgi:hypothetical protein